MKLLHFASCRPTDLSDALLLILFSSFIVLPSCNSPKTNETGEGNPTYNNELNEAENVVDANQIFEPCHWDFTVEQTSGDEVTLVAKVKIDSGWHLYSVKAFKDGPLPTSFIFDELANYKLEGNTEESNPQKEFDKFFSMEIFYFQNEAEFRQKIKVLSKDDFTITGTVEYMACLTQCVTLSNDFSFEVTGNPNGF